MNIFLVIGLIIVVAIVNQSGKKGAKKSKQSGGGDENFPFPDINPDDTSSNDFDPWDFKTIGDLLNGKPVQQSPVKEFDSKRVHEMVNLENTKSDQSSQQELKSETKELKVQPKEIVKESQDNSNEINPDSAQKLSIDFDLKRAILFSEVLKPKFKEY